MAVKEEVPEAIATEAEKFMYMAIFQASCAMALGNMSSAQNLLSDATIKINVENTYIPLATFGLIDGKPYQPTYKPKSCGKSSGKRGKR